MQHLRTSFGCRYYQLAISYFKSTLDKRLLELLWNKYWVNTLSSSPLVTVCELLPVRHAAEGLRFAVLPCSFCDLTPKASLGG